MKMKKIAWVSAMAAWTFLSAAAQDTTTTVIGKKLNFEAPLFGVSLKNEKPVWALTTFGELSGGMTWRFGTPPQMKPVGYAAELSIVELRYRPWRNGHLFTVGLSTAAQGNSLKKGWSWDENGRIAATPAQWLNAKSNWVELSFRVPVGYVYEWGDWKTGLWVVPGYGQTSLRNLYTLGTPMNLGGSGYGDVSPDGPVVYVANDGNRHLDQLNCNYGFRLGVKAGVSWHNVGFSVGYDFGRSVGPSHFTPRSGSVSGGVLVRH